MKTTRKVLFLLFLIKNFFKSLVESEKGSTFALAIRGVAQPG